MEQLEVWQVVALYAVIAALVTWLLALFNVGPEAADRVLMGAIWPIPLAFFVALSPLVVGMYISEFGTKIHNHLYPPKDTTHDR